MKVKIVSYTEYIDEIQYLTRFQKMVCRLFKITPAKKYSYTADVIVAENTPLMNGDIVYTLNCEKLYASNIGGNKFRLITPYQFIDNKPILGDEILIIHRTCSEYEIQNN